MIQVIPNPPRASKSCSIDKEIFINGGFSKYVEFWKMGMCKDETSARKVGPYVHY